jgi:hypothetical protein
MKKTNLMMMTIILSSLFFSLKADVVDVTHLISNSNFEGDANAWTAVHGDYSSYQQLNGCFEAKHTANNSTWFNCYQQISVPAGVYRLTANAFHRGYQAVVTNVILYGTTTAKEYSTGIKTLSSESTAYGSTPATLVDAKTAFNANFWLNTVDEIVVEDEGGGNGTLRIGIRNIAQPLRATNLSTGDIWTVWSNFKLYQLTAADLDSKRNQVVAEAGALLAEVSDYNDAGALAASKTTLEGIASADLTPAAIKTLQNDMLTYRNNRMGAAKDSKPVDATHLIKNAGFEDGQVTVLGTANGHYNEPKGWTLTYNTASTHVNNNVTVINNKVIPAGVAEGVTITPTQGERSLVARFRWTIAESFTVAQTVSSLPAGKYKISADLGKLSTAGTAVFNVKAGTVTVLNQVAAFVAGPAFTNTSATFYLNSGENLEIAATTTQAAQTEATIILDNIKLEYYGNEPLIIPSVSSLSFTPSVTERIINITAKNISSDITVAVPAGFSVSQSSISAAAALTNEGVNITVTSLATEDVGPVNLTLTSGTAEQQVALTVAETAINVSHAGLLFDQSFAPVTTITVTADLFNDIVLTAPAGVTLSEYSILKADAVAGKQIQVSWDNSSLVEDKEIEISSGPKSSTVKYFAVPNNMISNWDGDNAEGTGSRLTDFGWTLNNSLGDAVAGNFQNYNAGSGIRYVPMSSQVYTYLGKSWAGHRIAYLRTWAADASNTYNLPVTLEAGKTYIFRGVTGWHNNELNPTFTHSIRTGKDAQATVLATQSNNFTVRQAGADYKFEFTPTADGVHYVNVSSSAINDAMAAALYMAIYPKPVGTSVDNNAASDVLVYPTVTKGIVNIRAQENTTIRVFDLGGRMLINKLNSNETETIELTESGVFFIELNDGKERRTVKVVCIK